MTPRDVDDLNLEEFNQLTVEIDHYVREMKKGT